MNNPKASGAHTPNGWPIFDLRHHEKGIAEVQCFSCREWFAPVIEPSGNARGYGRYVAQCPQCKLRTWYELRDEARAALGGGK